MSIVYLALGSNIGNRTANCEEAVRCLNLIKGIEVIDKSEFYTTKPVGGPPQKDFINGVLKIETNIPPGSFLEVLKDIESNMGRELSDRNYPRIIDLDILLYDDVVIESEELTIPHPGMHERHFVLKGMVQIAPNTIHPVTKKTINDLYQIVLSC